MMAAKKSESTKLALEKCFTVRRHGATRMNNFCREVQEGAECSSLNHWDTNQIEPSYSGK